MRIAIVSDVLGKENNGTTIAAMNLIRFLKSRDHEVTVVCPDAERIGEEGYAVARRMHFGVLDNYVDKVGVCIAAPDTEVLLEVIPKCDVVHLVTPFLLTHKALKIAKEYNKPVTASFHCQAENFTSHIFLMGSKTANSAVYSYFYKSFYSYCDCVHYPTQFIRDVFEGEVSAKTNGYVISNGVNSRFTEGFEEKPSEYKDKFVIIFSGRYGKEKSHGTLIEAVARSKYKDKIQLIFAGAGPLESQIRKQSEKLLTNQPLMKFFSREEMLRVLRYSDLYVHPAVVEIEAIACLEAICTGLVPLIADSPRSATKAFALSDDNLFHFDDPDSLCGKIEFFIEHPERIAELREQYRGYTKRFDQRACMEAMEQMLFDAAEGKSRDEKE